MGERNAMTPESTSPAERVPPAESTPTTPSAPAPAHGTRKRWAFGTFGQLVIFTAIWAVLVTIFGLAAIAPMLLENGFEGSASTSGGLGPSSPTILVIAASTALATSLAIWLMHRFFGGPALLDLGLRRRPGWLVDSIIGLALGPLMFLAILLVLLAAGWVSVSPGTITGPELVISFITFALVAFSEEAFSRGWVLQVAERGYSTRVAVVVSAGLFAVLHAFNPGFGITALLGLFLAGLVLAEAYLVTRQLWLPMAFHLSWNYSEGPLFGFQVSGLPAEGLLTITPSGPDVVTGGPFGPEAGLVVIVGIGLGALVIAGLGRWRRQRQPVA
jgi:membrane protease YdiL (CAAX protease family)